MSVDPVAFGAPSSPPICPPRTSRTSPFFLPSSPSAPLPIATNTTAIAVASTTNAVATAATNTTALSATTTITTTTATTISSSTSASTAASTSTSTQTLKTTPAPAGLGAAGTPLSTKHTPRSSPLSPTTSALAMAAPVFQATQFRAPFGPVAANVHPYDRDPRSPARTPFGASTPPSSHVSVVIRNLPATTTAESVRFMLAWTTELIDVELLSAERTGNTKHRTALLILGSTSVANDVRNMFDGKPNVTGDADMMVDIIPSSPGSTRLLLGGGGGGGDGTPATTSSPSIPSPTSNVASSSRFAASFQSFDKIATSSGGFSSAELPGLFSPQSPIGNHLSERVRMSGKALIKNDAAEDAETGELLMQSIAFNTEELPPTAASLQRRATAPHLPSRMAALSLNTGSNVASSLPHHYVASPSAHPNSSNNSNGNSNSNNSSSSSSSNSNSNHSSSNSNIINTNPMSPTVLGSMSPYGVSQPSAHFPRSNFPAANPADQNPPCNTLYVGNLPIDTSEEELKAMFSKQRGYKRLCFRTKSNGPMCFVEFEDVSFATKALTELYGQMLHNSVKGGIRLSFSKNPLGVRSGQPLGPISPMNSINGVMSAHPNGFTTASGPPPGLTPPGLAGRALGYSPSAANTNSHGSHNHILSHHYTAVPYPANISNMWNVPSSAGAFGSAMTATAPANPHNGSSSVYLPSHMLGR